MEVQQNMKEMLAKIVSLTSNSRKEMQKLTIAIKIDQRENIAKGTGRPKNSKSGEQE